MANEYSEARGADRCAPGARITDRPDLMAWRRRHELRRSGAAQLHRTAKQYTRKQKHPHSGREDR